MEKLIITLLIAGLCALPQSGRLKPQTATTESGRRVALNSDGTWKYLDPEPAASVSLDGYSEKQQTALNDAVQAIRKLNDAVSFGLTFRDYAKKLAETKSTIEDATAALPDDSIRQRLLAVWKCHTKAFGWWNTLRTTDGIPLKTADMDDLLKELPRLKTARPDAATREEILLACWIEAADLLKPLLDLK